MRKCCDLPNTSVQASSIFSPSSNSLSQSVICKISLTQRTTSCCWRLGRGSRGLPAERQSSSKCHLQSADNCRGGWSQQLGSEQGLWASLFCTFLSSHSLCSLSLLFPLKSSAGWISHPQVLVLQADGSHAADAPDLTLLSQGRSAFLS